MNFLRSSIFIFLACLFPHHSLSIDQTLLPRISSVSKLIKQEGLAAGTLVKTDLGYLPIEAIKPGAIVVAYNCISGAQVLRRVLHIQKVRLNSFISLSLLNENLIIGHDQIFYDVDQNRWVDYALLPAVIKKGIHEESVYLYQLYVDREHNFYVTKSDILVHNVIPLVTMGASYAGSSAFAACMAAAGPVVAGGVPVVVSGIIVWQVAAYLMQKNNTGSQSDVKHTPPNKRGPDDPDDPEDPKEPNNNKKKKKDKKDKNSKRDYLKKEKKKKRDNARQNYRPLTNKEAREQASKMGYEEQKDPPFDSLEKPAFKKGNDWITPDKYGHRGGVWKRFFGKQRIGTYDLVLENRLGD